MWLGGEGAETVAGRQLPKDFHLRGSTFAQDYFPLGFFDDLNSSTKERVEEQPDYVVYLARRIWYLAQKLAVIISALKDVTSYFDACRKVHTHKYTV